MKNNKFIKILSTVLVAILVVSIAPINDAVATEMKNSANGVIKNIGEAIGNIDFTLPEIATKAEAAKNDYCRYEWAPDTSTLSVWGRGVMPNYNKETAPWAKHNDVEHLVIRGDITSIGISAFKDFTKIEDVIIEAPVTLINGMAFQGCTSLKNVVLPDTLKSIYGGVFKGCTNLKELVIPDSVTAIYGSLGGSNLEKLTTPFVGGGPDNTSETKTDQLGYMFGTTEYENTYAVKSRYDSKVKYFVPDSLKSVTVTQALYKYGFENSIGIEEVIIEASVKNESIPACYVQGCTNLKNFEINSKRIYTIGMYAFSKCDALEKLVLPQNLKKIMSYAFYNCTNLTDIQFPNRDFAVEYYSFKNAKFITDFTDEFFVVGDGVLIYYNGNNDKVVVPQGVKRIGDAFTNHTEIVEISLPDSLSHLSKGAFYGCTSIENLVIPDSVQTIDASALLGLCNLKSLSIPFTGNSRDAKEETTAPLFGYIFGADSKCPICSNNICTTDTQYYKKKNGNNYYDYSFSYLYPKGLNTVTVTDNIIPRDAFRSSNVKEVILGDGVTAIKPYAFYSSSLKKIVFNEVITTLPDSVFSKCSNLKSVTLTSSIKSINGAFENCTGLVTVNFVEGLESISKGFLGCEWLREFTLPDSLKSIKNRAFGNCKAIKEFRFGTGLQEISADAFVDDRDDYGSVEAFYIDEENPYLYSFDGVVYSYAGDLVAYPENKKATSFYINKNVKKIYRNTLDQMDITKEFIVDPDNEWFTAIDGILYNKDVTTLIRCPREKTGKYVSPETVVDVQSLAFFRCCSLDKIEFVNGAVDFDDGAFQSVSVKDFIVPNLNNELEYYFANDSYSDIGICEITNLKITNQKRRIEDYFADCVWGLKTVEIDGTYHTIGRGAFSGCSFEEFTIPDSVTWIDEYAFDQSNIKRVYGGNNIRTIGRAAFADTDLEYFEIPEALETLGSFAFAGVNLTEVVFHDKLVEVGYQVFNYSKIKRAVISEAIAHLSDKLFVNCFDLETVVIGGAVESIGEKVFESCTALETVIIPSNVTEISDNAFLDANEDVVIYCNEGSYAQQYAIANDIKYTTLVIDPIENQVYTGEEITPEVKASANNRRLTQDTEYTVSYKDNINAGSAKVIAKGLGDFKHLVATAKFTILPKDAAEVRALNTGSVYSPKGVIPEIYVFSGSNRLVQGQDYEILENSVLKDAGEYNIAVSLIGNYDGVVNIVYKISRKPIAKTNIEYGNTVKITYQGVTLEEGKDYTVIKETNENGDIVTTVKGIGNYSGTDSYTQKSNNQSSSSVFNWFENFINAIRRLFSSLFNIGV